MKERLFSMHFSRGEDDSITVSTEFHATLSGREILSAMRMGIRGMMEAGRKIANDFEMSDGEFIEFLFGDVTAIEAVPKS